MVVWAFRPDSMACLSLVVGATVMFLSSVYPVQVPPEQPHIEVVTYYTRALGTAQAEWDKAIEDKYVGHTDMARFAETHMDQIADVKALDAFFETYHGAG